MTCSGPARAAARPLASSAAGAPAARHLPPSGRLVAAVALAALIGTGCSNAPAEAGRGGGEPDPDMTSAREKCDDVVRADRSRK